MDTSKSSPSSKPKSAIHKISTDPLIVSPEIVVRTPSSTESSVIDCPQKQPSRIAVHHPNLLNELLATTPTILIDQQAYAKSAIEQTIPNPPPTDGSFYLEIEKQFDPKVCCIATTNQVAPFAPIVYVEGNLFKTNLYCCAPLEFYLLQDLKHLNHGFKCDQLGLQPAVGQVSASLARCPNGGFIYEQ